MPPPGGGVGVGFQKREGWWVWVGPGGSATRRFCLGPPPALKSTPRGELDRWNWFGQSWTAKIANTFSDYFKKTAVCLTGAAILDAMGVPASLRKGRDVLKFGLLPGGTPFPEEEPPVLFAKKVPLPLD